MNKSTGVTMTRLQLRGNKAQFAGWKDNIVGPLAARQTRTAAPLGPSSLQRENAQMTTGC
ncbi:hypothetical protein PC129_g22519 [Phytophthora cactorum]|uniref:Uncharacterized protein n=1 Tax=Phytophthora cactorum TaxID=29920 RepID=A0A8T1H2P2_9STRA|nr:hypothetical protein PC117_g14712 [Phytophthora cactorum]KAG2998680.1 hypothetical protein PC120_g21092 [Phytophthora cactorum]KAG3006430.1 hypothetical protein PC119_g14980 [Phytophthora cactorum]KAG3168668.1 hypothetical protein C6341_g11240 [Phytophthora cactorum]KAG3196923.1 hypothetical protein PC128_g7217 [Phytophthora cactorum]